jgi:hypothetical protein
MATKAQLAALTKARMMKRKKRRLTLNKKAPLSRRGFGKGRKIALSSGTFLQVSKFGKLKKDFPIGTFKKKRVVKKKKSKTETVLRKRVSALVKQNSKLKKDRLILVKAVNREDAVSLKIKKRHNRCRSSLARCKVAFKKRKCKKKCKK